MTPVRVLVTGMSGLIGGAVRKRLEGRYELSALNRSLVPGVQTFQADIADLEAIRPAFVGQDVVIHLAACKGCDWNDSLQANIIGTYNVYEASRESGVKRVIYASSGAAVSGWQEEEPYKAILEGRYADVPVPWPMLTHETPVRSWSLYGSTKVWGEAVGRHFADTTDLSILCLRIAVVNTEDRPPSQAIAPVWCSQRDVVQMIERCILAPPTLKYDIFNVTSNNRWGFRDISHAREVVGYEPQDSAEDYPL